MRTLRRYLAKEIIAATALVVLALLMLFAFFDLLDEIKDLGRGGYRMKHIVFHVLLRAPSHVYELFPIAALIGTLFALAQLVASSEYTVMRTSGLSVARLNLDSHFGRAYFCGRHLRIRRIYRPTRGAVCAAPALAGDRRDHRAGVSLWSVGEGRQEFRQRGGGNAGLAVKGCAHL